VFEKFTALTHVGPKLLHDWCNGRNRVVPSDLCPDPFSASDCL
jgi:hypothetical protein